MYYGEGRFSLHSFPVAGVRRVSNSSKTLRVMVDTTTIDEGSSLLMVRMISYFNVGICAFIWASILWAGIKLMIYVLWYKFKLHV